MKLLIIGGAGYVGSELVRKLHHAYPHVEMVIFDTFWYWDSYEEYREAVQSSAHRMRNLSLFPGDIRDELDLKMAMRGCDQVINLACISNDPSSDLHPKFTHSVNYDGVRNVIDIAAELNIERLIHASSSSVYGVTNEPFVTEQIPTNPLTQYSDLKVKIDEYLLTRAEHGQINACILRPATVCGYSVRQRLDLVLNIFCRDAWNHGEIKVHGGNQFRPNLNIADMVNAYIYMMNAELYQICGQVFNVGDQNYTLLELANMVRKIACKQPFEKEVQIIVEESTDQRSYRLDSTRLSKLGWKPQIGIENAIYGLLIALQSNTVKFDKTSNIEVMKSVISA